MGWDNWELSAVSTSLRGSLQRQEEILRSSLVLNPVENFPFPEDIAPVASAMHGIYNSDKTRDRAQRLETPIQFAGRREVESDVRSIYSAWARALGAADATLRPLSGLHAHIVLFMAMAQAGQSVLLLPTRAGGHMSGKAIVERLGLEVTEMEVDEAGMCVDIDATLTRCAEQPPDFVFVDRSEGLVFEDFSRLAGVARSATIFDASQYLSNVVAGEHPNPFEWGFDLMVASVHKNFPGPQKALLASRRNDETWRRLTGGVSTYVSNMHTPSIYAAGLTLARSDWLSAYSKRMLAIAPALEAELADRGVPVVRRRDDLPPTHHIWIREEDRERAFVTYERLEQCLILTNFRQLPYSLGYGIRLGVNAAVRLGMNEDDVSRLAELIAEVRRRGATDALRREARSFSRSIWSRS
jgi:glycine hydroxymethyltransferase